MTPHPRRAAWDSLLGHLVAEQPGAVLAALQEFVPDHSNDQTVSWTRSLEILQTDGREVIERVPESTAHGSILEYLLPREGGRRPDVILLQDAAVLVIEFKNKVKVNVGDIDQVAAYARDLREYHSGCHGLPVIPILLYVGSGPRVETAGVTLTTSGDFATLVAELARKHAHTPPKLELSTWLEGRYEPLPGIVEAARLLFKRLPLPFIRRAHSFGIPETVAYVLDVYERARAECRNHLVLLTGVPGAGKTLVGLQVVHSDRLQESYGPDEQHLNPATFLSGNGPLVQVLQDALKSKAFVQDMHRFIREYAIEHPELVPPERFIVFDEAQRAWTAGKVGDFYAKKGGLEVDRSEPELLISVADRIPGGCVVLGLVGSGQEIHTGEECGIEGWLAAVNKSAEPAKWEVHAPPGVVAASSWPGFGHRTEERLSLDGTLRSHAAEALHAWVNHLLDEPETEATELASLAASLLDSAFPILLTRDLDVAKEYARARFEGEPLRRYGLLASSKAKNLAACGVDNRFDRFFPTAKWFNAAPDDPKSCCRLEKPAQEFHCQGLELDLPIVCWGDDFWWEPGGPRWAMRKAKTNPLVLDPYVFRKNTYRVLLTRGREGLVLFVPPGSAAMDATAARLEACGAMTVEGRRRSAVKVVA